MSRRSLRHTTPEPQPRGAPVGLPEPQPRSAPEGFPDLNMVSSMAGLKAICPFPEHGAGPKAINLSAGLMLLAEHVEKERHERKEGLLALRRDVEAQRVMVARIAEVLVQGSLEETIKSVHRAEKELVGQQEQQDVQAAALRETLLEVKQQHADLRQQGAELASLREHCDRVTEELKAAARKRTVEIEQPLLELAKALGKEAEHQEKSSETTLSPKHSDRDREQTGFYSLEEHIGSDAESSEDPDMAFGASQGQRQLTARSEVTISTWVYDDPMESLAPSSYSLDGTDHCQEDEASTNQGKASSLLTGP
eukprot:CAMPEP_0172707556 /NCGR_PEP_ID=MMETSP1074-20121228/50036_1 /TAXON_ID=2916 /ORGANISM="Ceratium fusus, Strain PA161109" /LENGTH=308 /DNA_ID=CAMNT_0013530381 /DNA_START=37 /DNA_END=963 /DNA_ORIENTATION=-